jgi:hypothetical protein
MLTAEHFSPWTPRADVAAFVADNSRYPPLFPLLLGFFSGGNILLANLTTVVFVLIGFAISFFWFVEEKLSEWKALALTFTFAILPVTYMQVLYVLSESLYLIFSMGCLLAVARSEKTGHDRPLFLAALCIAATTLTRNAGWILFLAFAIYLVLNNKNRKIFLLLAVAALPGIAWSVYRGISGGTEEISYIDIINGWYSGNPWGILQKQLIEEPVRFWEGLSSAFTAGFFTVKIFGVFGVLFAGACAYRTYLRKLDGIYVALYLAVLLLWPFGDYAWGEKRYVFVVIPILMFQAWFAIHRLSKQRFKRFRFNPPEVLYFSLVILLALPALASAAARHTYPLSAELEPFRRFGWWIGWYVYDTINVKPEDMAYAAALTKGLRAIGETVPENACVYSVKTDTLHFYMRRVGYAPPAEALNDDAFRNELAKTKCEYFFFMSDTSSSISMKRFYPIQRVEKDIRIVAQIHASHGNAKGPIGILAQTK